MFQKQQRSAGKRFAILCALVSFLKFKTVLITFGFEHNYIKKWCYAGGAYKQV